MFFFLSIILTYKYLYLIWVSLFLYSKKIQTTILDGAVYCDLGGIIRIVL